MANTDWGQPTNSTHYSLVLQELKDLSAMAATLMRVDNAPTTGQDPDAGAVEGSIKWSVSGSTFQKNIATTGAVWADLAPLYNINVAKIGTTSESMTMTQVTDIDNLTTGNPLNTTTATGKLSSNLFDDVSHGIRGAGSLHPDASKLTKGFMSIAHYNAVEAITPISGPQIVTLYDSQIIPLIDSDVTSKTTDTKTITGDILDSAIDAKLGNGVKAVLFGSPATVDHVVYKDVSGTVNINVKEGQYQKIRLTAATSLTFSQYTGQPFTMYLYVNTQDSHILTLQSGNWSGQTIPVTNIKSAGTELITINSDGSSLYYMLLADMRVV